MKITDDIRKYIDRKIERMYEAQLDELYAKEDAAKHEFESLIRSYAAEIIAKLCTDTI